MKQQHPDGEKRIDEESFDIGQQYRLDPENLTLIKLNIMVSNHHTTPFSFP